MSLASTRYPYFPMKVEHGGLTDVVVSPSTRERFTLNADASFLAMLCDGYHSLDEIVDHVSNVRKCPRESASSAADRILSLLTDKGMVWWRGARLVRRPAPRPRLFYWDLTLRCNLQCAHCVLSAGERNGQELNTEECLRVLDEVAAAGVSGVVLSGGEPMLREDLFAIAGQALDLGLTVQMATNGTLITHPLAQRMADLGMDVQVSLDGSTPAIHDVFRKRKGAFDQALRGCTFLREAGASFMVGSVIHRNNLHDVRALHDLCVKIGAHTFRPIPFIASGRGKRHAELEPSPTEFMSVIKEIQELRSHSTIHITEQQFECTFREGSGSNVDSEQRFACSGASPDFSITADGDVLPCSFFEGVQALNVRKEPFAWIWENAPILIYFRDIRATDVNGVCHRCSWLADCLGGCPAANFAAGRMLQPNVQCWKALEFSDTAEPLPP